MCAEHILFSNKEKMVEAFGEPARMVTGIRRYAEAIEQASALEANDAEIVGIIIFIIPGDNFGGTSYGLGIYR